MEELLVYEHPGTGYAVTTHRVVRGGREICDPTRCVAGYRSAGWFQGKCIIIAVSSEGIPFRQPNVKRGLEYLCYYSSAPLRLLNAIANKTGDFVDIGPPGLSGSDAKEVTHQLNAAFQKVVDLSEEQRRQAHSAIRGLKKL
jgi:hypothetical protein